MLSKKSSERGFSLQRLIRETSTHALWILGVNYAAGEVNSFTLSEQPCVLIWVWTFPGCTNFKVLLSQPVIPTLPVRSVQICQVCLISAKNWSLMIY